MIEGVAVDGVPSTDECGHCTEIGRVAGGEGECGFSANEGSDSVVNLIVRGGVPADECGSYRTGSECVDGNRSSVPQCRMRGETEIVVRAEEQALTAVHGDDRPACAVDAA